MSDLIRREDAIKTLHKHFSSGFDCDRWWNSTTVLFALNSVPSADRQQGEWIKDNLGTVICSECKRPRRDNRINHINFCNSCGARMKGADDDI